jgi:hypothetical protein
MMRPASRAFLAAALTAALTAATATALAPAALARPDAAPSVTASSPIRIVAATSSVTDATLKTWQPDAPYALGGQLTTTPQVLARTASDVLYQHARVGVAGYNIPVSAPGTYFVDLFTSETQGAQPGERVWNVTAEGSSVATNVDTARDAGPATASHVLFAVPVTDGVLNIRTVAQVGTPLVDAVEVDYEKAATTTSTLFSDDFDGGAGSSPDATKWGLAEGGNGWGNSELETYTRRTSNAALDGAGNLDVVA